MTQLKRKETVLKSQRADQVCHFNVASLEDWFSLLGGQNIKMNMLKTQKQNKAIQKAWHPGEREILACNLVFIPPPTPPSGSWC